jgi:hypothetical protein
VGHLPVCSKDCPEGLSGDSGKTILVVNDSGQLLGLLNPFLHHGEGGRASDKPFFLVGLQHLLKQILRVPLCQLHDGVYTGSFKQLGILSLNAFDAFKISMVEPGQNSFSTDTGFFSNLLASRGVLPLSSRAAMLLMPASRNFAPYTSPIPSTFSNFGMFLLSVARWSRFVTKDHDITC